MTPDDFKKTIQETEDLQFCRNQLFCPYMWFFEDYPGKDRPKGDYFSFRTTVAEIINENPNNVAIVGSAKYGFSMKPGSERTFQPFNDESDIDIVIISPAFFLTIRDAYRTAFYSGYYWLNDKHSKDIFRNFVIVDTEEREEYKSAYLKDIWDKMQELQKGVAVRHRITRPIKFRIYSSWEDADNYHAAGISKLRKNIEEAV